MWNNTKDIPANYEFHVTSLYEYDKRIETFMSSEGECVAMLTVGRFILYLDAVGEASFRYKSKIYRQRQQLTEELVELIQEDSDKIRWIEKPEIRLYLTFEDDAYSGFELGIKYEKLPNALALEVMMARMLVDSILIIDREKVVSIEGVTGVSHLFTDNEKRTLDILHNYKQLTTVLTWSIEPEEAIDQVYNRIAEEDGLANVVSMVNVLTQQREQGDIEITTAWTSDNHAVDTAMRYVSGVW